jgi:hypothetical protein
MSVATRISGYFISAATFMLLLITIGCDGPTMSGIRFCVLDAKSGAPLSGAYVRQSSIQWDMIAILWAKSYDATYGPTDVNGKVLTNRLYIHWENTFCISKAGYGSRALLMAGDNGIVLISADSQGREEKTFDAREPVLVPLYRVNATSTLETNDQHPGSVP